MNTLPRSLAPIAAFFARHSAIIALAVFAAAGAAIVDDYGVGFDTGWQRQIGYASFDYILGDESAALDADDHNRFYGVAFELPLIAAERALGLDDSRGMLLSRHLLAHLFFLAAGFFAWLLTHRLFGNRLVALFAMLVFLLHPRIYAHSFFNSKDLPFLSMFMVALYLIHRAFRRDSVWAFALCGAGIGLLANMRIMGVMLAPAVLGMLALDVFYAVRRGEGGAKHEIVNICAFSTMFAATFYAAFPLLWRDPLAFADALSTLSQHPWHGVTLFRGAAVQWPNLPWDFIPIWALITAPPVVLILAALGIGYLARLCAADWRAALANSPARFGLLSLACLILPVAAAIALNSNMYNDWRQMYFLYAPFCVLAAFGLRALADIPKTGFRAAAFALAALGIAVVVIQMVQIHPYQNVYFNSLVGKNGLAERWEMDYWFVSHREALEAILKIQPTGRVAVEGYGWNSAIIPEYDRRRLYINRAFPSFRISRRGEADAAVWAREVYGVPIVSVVDTRAESDAAFRAAFASARDSLPNASAGGFDMYADADGGALAYIKEDCEESDTRGRFLLSVFPANPSDLPKFARDAGLEHHPLNFSFDLYGMALGGKCAIVIDLPDYTISHIETGQWTEYAGLWSARILFDAYYRRYADALASLSGEPAIRSDFDVHMQDAALIYVKEPCAESDARGRFLLSVFPADQNDLPQSARDAGLEHEPLNFDFHRHGAIFDGKCVIVRELPDYPISHMETGQWLPDEGGLWNARILLDGYYDRYRDALASLSGEPAIRSEFDVYAEGGALTYVKENCVEDDARGRFLLSVFPADQNDLPQSALDAGLGHEPLNFDFHRHGAIFDGKCVIIRDLPDYRISRVETGQWIPGEGGLWGTVEIPLDGYYDRYRRALASLSGEPAARSVFDVYAEGGALTYLKDPCAEDDARARFSLSVFPSDQDDLPQTARDDGLEHEPLNFDFADYGAIFDGKCVIIRDLPDYPIKRVETGQWIPGEGGLWSVEIAVGD